MPAKSKAQQRFFGVVEAYKKGKIKNPSKDVVRAAESMSDEDVRHFASTKHDGLQEKKSQALAILTSAYLLKRRHDSKKQGKKNQEQKKDLDVEFVDSEKKAWQKTPVHVQNGKVEYDFESIEEAAAFLTSVGILSSEDVMDMLSSRAGMINGFAVSYPGEKIAQQVVLVDPHRRMRTIVRARKVFDGVNEPEDDKDEKKLEEKFNKEVEDNKKTVDSLTKAVVELASLLS